MPRMTLFGFWAPGARLRKSTEDRSKELKLIFSSLEHLVYDARMSETAAPPIFVNDARHRVRTIEELRENSGTWLHIPIC